MCDTVIDEHFRRSLGNDYIALLTNEKTNKMIKLEVPSPPTLSTVTHEVATPPPPPAAVTPTRSTPPATPVAPVAVAEIVTAAVNYVTTTPSPPPPVEVVVAQKHNNTSDDDDGDNEISVDDHFAKALGNDMWKKIQEKSLKS
jgi:hypothetical protein